MQRLVSFVPCLGEVVIDTTVVFRNVCHELRHGRTPRLISLARVGSIELVTAPHVPIEARRLLPKMARAVGATLDAAEAVLDEHLAFVSERQPSDASSVLVDRVAADDASDAPLAAVLVEAPTAWLLSDDGVFVRAGAQSPSERELLELISVASTIDAGMAGLFMTAAISWHAGRAHPSVALAALLALGVLAVRDPKRAKGMLHRAGTASASALARRNDAVQRATTLQALPALVGE